MSDTMTLTIRFNPKRDKALWDLLKSHKDKEQTGGAGGEAKRLMYLGLDKGRKEANRSEPA